MDDKVKLSIRQKAAQDKEILKREEQVRADEGQEII